MRDDKTRSLVPFAPPFTDLGFGISPITTFEHIPGTGHEFGHSTPDELMQHCNLGTRCHHGIVRRVHVCLLKSSYHVVVRLFLVRFVGESSSIQDFEHTSVEPILLKSMSPQKKVPLQAWSRGAEKSASRNHSRDSRAKPAQVTEDIGFCPATNRSSLTACRLKVSPSTYLAPSSSELIAEHFSVQTDGFLLIVAESSNLLSTFPFM